MRPARQAAHDGAPVIVVEGYVDVIAMVGAGFAGAVAPLGTALTENQLALIWRMADEPILCFDGDKAGQKAAYRAADLALPLFKPGKSLRFALLPEGQDPDDLARVRRTRRDRGSDRSRARACRHRLVARDRGRQFCDARAPRRTGSADRRTRQRRARRCRAPLLSRGFCRPTAARLCARGGSRRRLRRAAISARAPANHPAVFRPAAGAPGRPVCAPGAGRGRPRRPWRPAPTRRRARNWLQAR